MLKKSFAPVLCLVALCTVVSCGDDNDQPGATPGDVPGEVLDSWSQVRAQIFCDDCPTENLSLTVRNDGTTSLGDVSVTNEELGRLANVADPLASADLSGSMDCEEQDELEDSATIVITQEDGTTRTVVQANRSTDQICTRGDRGQALQLLSVMRELAIRYASGPSPTPTPSPTFTTLAR
jgi:hypothetical protein